MIHMIFTSINEATLCWAQINKNKGLVLPAQFDYVHEWFNTEHVDYIEGGRASFMKPTGGRTREYWLHDCEQFTYTLKEEDESWYSKIYPPEEDPVFP